MLLLALETSCDETSVAVLEVDDRSQVSLRSDLVASQIAVHELYGGVVPELASREHLANLPLIVEAACTDASCSLEQLEGIVVTSGPGLHGCLLMGVSFAKGLALARGIPFVGVNHIEGHLHAVRLDCPQAEYPYLALVVSGGHTELVEVHDVGSYRVWARTSDDAAGEAFDKAAHLLGLPYPGGPRLAALADQTSTTRFQLPKVMRETPGFSFSGLKTAIALLVKREADALRDDPTVVGQLAKTIQDSIVDVLLFKLRLAMKESGFSRVVLTGGVAANQALRKAAGALPGIELFAPLPKHCTDNAAMIGYVGAMRLRRGERSGYDLDARSRWPIEELTR